MSILPIQIMNMIVAGDLIHYNMMSMFVFLRFWNIFTLGRTIVMSSL